MLSHKNIMSNVKGCLPLLPVGSESKALSFLPLNHIFERMLNYLYMASAVSIYYAEHIDKIADNLKEVKPEIFTTVPRLMEKVYEKIISKGKEQSLIGRAVFFGALNVAQQYKLEGNSWFYNQILKLCDNLVFSKWREALGGNIRLVISGSAALNPKLIKIFTAAGIPILEGYGLTETSPVISVNRWEIEGRKLGTVGKPIKDVEVKIADDGEVLCKGPNVMKGYYKLEDKTKEVLEEDGWFHTEDIGSIDDEGFLSITDRKDSVFKTSGGKKVAPQPIENTLKESFLIDQIIVLGEKRKMVTALISPDFENLEEWCEDHDIEYSSQEDIIKNEEVLDRFKEIVEEKNQELSHTEQIKKFRLVPDNWSVESGELTPTQKIKREVILDQYEDLIENLYKEE
jgi:long-chain acyl-CoA synthetase